jgi:hypothetical protein
VTIDNLCDYDSFRFGQKWHRGKRARSLPRVLPSDHDRAKPARRAGRGDQHRTTTFDQEEGEQVRRQSVRTGESSHNDEIMHSRSRNERFLSVTRRQLADIARNRVGGASAMVILCCLQKSRTWRCTACQRFTDSSFSSRSTPRSAFPRAKDACGVYLSASLTHGGREMPAWGQVYTRELQARLPREYPREVVDQLVRERILTIMEYLSALQEK